MSHEVFVCYDIDDKYACESVVEAFEANDISCWYYARDFKDNESVNQITEAIQKSKTMVVIYSKTARFSKHVATEVDIAFSAHRSITIFNIDGASKKGNLEFFKVNTFWLSAFPNNYDQARTLIHDVSGLLGRHIENPQVKRNIKFKPPRIKKYLAIAISVALILILLYLFVIAPMGQHTTDDGVISLNITGVDVKEINGKYIYTVYGDAYNIPQNASEYIMVTKYYDKDGRAIYSLNATLDEFSSGKICQFDFKNDNINRVSLKLIDLYDNEICEDSFSISSNAN